MGHPVTARAVFRSSGPEPWHPNPDFYYQPGGGPLLDMGPYYITSLVQALGPVVRVQGTATRARTERVIGSGPRAGTVLPVEVDTQVFGILEFAQGATQSLKAGKFLYADVASDYNFASTACSRRRTSSSRSRCTAARTSGTS